jgi:REP element-mobilizing transposase RayT
MDLMNQRSDSNQRSRRSIRLKEYDYSQAGAYFVTACTHRRKCLFGEIAEGKIVLNMFGKIVEEEWHRTKQMRQGVDLDVFIVMPNHIHGIIVLTGTPLSANRRGTMHRAPTPQFEQFGRPTANSIPTIIRGFKSSVTQRIIEIRATPGAPVWQRNYYEHVIRNEIDLEETREYIQNNPLKWLEDEYYPTNIEKIKS